MTQEHVHFVDKSAEGETGDASADFETPTLSQPGLLVMDVDSTLIDEEVIDELGEAAGKGEEIADVTERAMRGELEFCDALRARVALLRGLPVSVFDTVHDKLHFTNGALDLIDTLHEHGWKVGVVSGGFHEVVDKLAAEGNIDFWIANRLETEDGKLTGQVLGEIVCKTVKLHALRAWAERLGIPMSQTVAVGDGANDIPMIQAAGLGLAFCAKPKTQLAADDAINTRDLRLVLDYLR
ncbi:phosphoserine phosphatase SerB [Bifidobacterium sp. LC6]|uniref:phosphoserine phosphatase n=1 Tax=Bifidobacterium colobi TaxID=2809026 RepID=A0ABS5UV97_9BIFI|nr:phosphoserine phosphatase SerB [Bifidobacterium colobi]MBT1174997.1 phosphoserine phosphatase SerB [Bifidobacterium colobi]